MDKQEKFRHNMTPSRACRVPLVYVQQDTPRVRSRSLLAREPTTTVAASAPAVAVAVVAVATVTVATITVLA